MPFVPKSFTLSLKASHFLIFNLTPKKCLKFAVLFVSVMILDEKIDLFSNKKMNFQEVKRQTGPGSYEMPRLQGKRSQFK